MTTCFVVPSSLGSFIFMTLIQTWFQENFWLPHSREPIAFNPRRCSAYGKQCMLKAAENRSIRWKTITHTYHFFLKFTFITTKSWSSFFSIFCFYKCDVSFSVNKNKLTVFDRDICGRTFLWDWETALKWGKHLIFQFCILSYIVPGLLFHPGIVFVCYLYILYI